LEFFSFIGGFVRHTGIVTDKDFLTQNDECYGCENGDFCVIDGPTE
jgi:hypothetical protein